MEICVDSIDSAVNAHAGGATRIELCSALSEGGLTPSVGVLIAIKKLVNIPIFVMIRPRRGDFCYTNEEVEAMCQDISTLKDCGADGFVFGALTTSGCVDRSVCARLLSLASPLPCTFHRAFDVSRDPEESLDSLITLGFSRLLTSGLCKTAELGALLIKKLIDNSNGRITVMPGAGITVDNLEAILQITGAREFHASARKSVPTKMNHVNDDCNMGQACNEYELLVTNKAEVEKMVAKAHLVWSEL